MKDIGLYLKWIAILCVGMALFGIGVFIIGYKDLSMGRVMTVVALFVAAGVCGLLSRKKLKR